MMKDFVICLALGMGLRKTGKLPDNFVTSLMYVMYCALPGLVLWKVPSMKMGTDKIHPNTAIS